MASIFECEVRFPIKNVDSFKKRLMMLGGKLAYGYEFDDHYYYPGPGVWNPIKKTLRIRYWRKPKNPTVIYFAKNEVVKKGNIKFKRSSYTEGKLPLYSGELSLCQELLEDLGLKKWFTLEKRKAEFWNIPQHDFDTVFEYIPGLGWSGELEEEGEDIELAKEHLATELSLLGIDSSEVDYRPVSVIYAEHTGLLK